MTYIGVLKDEELSMIIEVFDSNKSYSGTVHGVSGQDETLSSYSPTENVCIFEVKCERSCDKQPDQLTLSSTGEQTSKLHFAPELHWLKRCSVSHRVFLF